MFLNLDTKVSGAYNNNNNYRFDTFFKAEKRQPSGNFRAVFYRVKQL